MEVRRDYEIVDGNLCFSTNENFLGFAERYLRPTGDGRYSNFGNKKMLDDYFSACFLADMP